MAWYWIALIAYGVVAVLYSLRLCQLYFQVLEGATGNGLIITSAIWAGIILPVSILRIGFQGVIVELLPPKVGEPEVMVDPPPNHVWNPHGPMPVGIMPPPEVQG